MSTRAKTPLTPLREGGNNAINDSDPIDSDPIDSLGLYIHFPWCVQKCPYCDFNSSPISDSFDEKTYLQTLIDDLMRDINQFEIDRPIQTIFLGGGTPSLISPDGISWLIDHISNTVSIETGAEISLEANPGTFDKNTPEKWRAAGINRISLGVQSFNDKRLITLGRIHNSKEAINAIEWCQNSFDRLNIDLMFGLLQQSVSDIQYDLKQIHRFDPGHVSWYQLTIEPDTPFGKTPPQLPDEETIEQIFDEITSSLTSARYSNYEISAWAKPGHQCRHNLNYWQYGDYLGIGAGAHGKITCNGKVFRTTKPDNPQRYLKGTPISPTEIFPEEIITEFLLNALRLENGFAESLFEARTHQPCTTISNAIHEALDSQLLERSNGMIRPTSTGRLYLDSLLEKLTARI